MELFSREEAASYLKIGKRYLDKLRLSGKGPKFIKLGEEVNGLIKYEKKDLEDWIRSFKN